MLRKQSEFRILKHDLKNLLLSINFQLAQGNVDTAQKLLENITLTATSSFQTYTGCWPIDTVLSSKINEMNTENILYSLDLKIPADLDFKHNVVDICAILGNILDNAIEECNRIDSPKKEIKISIHYRDDKIIMKVTNPARINNLNISSKLIRSAKRKGRYGLGINSIRERVQKLEGYSDFSWNENEFKVLIIIPVGQSIAQ
ncbi:ATP-binding protein [Enterococcus diestrammenae]